MQFTYSDDEISEMLKNSCPVPKRNFQYNQRIFDFWLEDLSSGYPYPGVDMKYHRYFLVFPFYLESDDRIYVNDIKNPYFSVTLDEFLSMDVHGKLPVEITRTQRRIKNLKIGLTLLFLSALIGFAVAEYLMY